MKNKPFLRVGIFGLTTVGVLALVLSFVGPTPDEVYQAAYNSTSPILSFEFVRTEQEVKALFFCPERLQGIAQTCQPPTETILDKMDRANRLDFLFALCYPAFLAFFAWRASQIIEKRHFFQIALGLAVVISGADFVENWQLLAITHHLRQELDFQAFINILQGATWVKWLLLAVLLAWFGVQYFYPKEHRILGGLFVIPLVLGVLALFYPSIIFSFSLSITVSFAILAIYCVVKTPRHGK